VGRGINVIKRSGEDKCLAFIDGTFLGTGSAIESSLP
jgi:hypothetical protein